TARSRRSLRSLRISSSWTGSSRTSWASSRPRRSAARGSSSDKAEGKTYDRPPRRVRAGLPGGVPRPLPPRGGCARPGPVRSLFREEQGRLRQLLLARLQEPALRGLLLPRVRAAPRPRRVLCGERVSEGLGGPEARDPLPDPAHPVQDAFRV